MRKLLIASCLLASAACNDSPDALKDPPVLKVTSPARSTIQGKAGQLQVTGTVSANEISGEPVEKVLVNNVQATVNADGSFTALITLKPGATLITTSARDAAGQVAEDTRAIHAGELRAVGTNIENAITAAMSKTAFAKLSAAAGPMIEGLDLGAMLAPMQPMVHSGDEAGEDCLFARMYVDGASLTNAEISIVPTNAGLQFRAQIDGLDVPGHARYAVACVNGSNTVRVKAQRVVVSGTLVVTPSGNQGFKTALTGETVQITGLNIQASGIPGTIIDLLSLDKLAGYVVSKLAPLAMEPMMNKALGGLAGPQTVDVMGKTLTMEVDPSTIEIDASGALITLNTKMMIKGTEKSPGYIFTDNGMPNMDAGNGFQLGLADDMANMMMAELKETGLMNLHMPAVGGTFDNTSIEMSLPPMISADPADGQLKLILGDMMATFTDHGAPVAKAAINAAVELKVVPAANGYGVALQLGKPTTKVTILDDIANTTRLLDKDLKLATEGCLAGQIDAVSKLLVSIPLPAVAGLQMRNMSLDSDDGFVMLKGDIE
jgi:glucodextranase-like protein